LPLETVTADAHEVDHLLALGVGKRTAIRLKFQGVLRDISELFTRQKINVTAVKTRSQSGMARMRFTLELASGDVLQRTLAALREVPGVLEAKRD
jgi:(p)ppGpp synthase/HD superfamily hydrolase